MPLPDREKAAALGRALRRVRDSVQKQDPAARTSRIWFQGPEPYLDALFEVSGEALLWFQVTVRGRSLTWDARRRRVSTGHTGELSAEGPLAPASRTIAEDGQSDRRAVEAVAGILLARPGEFPFDAAAAVLTEWLSKKE